MEQQRPSRKGGRQHVVHSRYDQAMFAAKNAGTQVLFSLATETYFTDEDCSILGLICQVDKYDIEIEIQEEARGDKNRKVWLKKALIVSTEVLK